MNKIYRFPQRYTLRTTAVRPMAMGHQRVETTDYWWDNKKLWIEYDYYFIQYTLSGYGILETQGKTFKVVPGKAFLAWIKRPLRYYFDGKTDHWEFVWLGMSGAAGKPLFLEIMDEFGPVVELGRESRSIKFLYQLMEQAKNKTWENLEATSPACYRFLVELQADLRARKAGEGQDKIKWAISHFKRHLSEPLDVSVLSLMSGCSREHFTRLFIKETGGSPGIYFTGLRLKEAQTLLRGTDMSLKEIAAKTGLCDANYLCRLFRKRFGLTPLQYKSTFDATLP
ncbi:MAG: AraC family transcriptional regulator [Fibrobacterota bacterium]